MADNRLCPYCGKPETADHWRRIAAGWERLGLIATVLAFTLGLAVGAAVWAV